MPPATASAASVLLCERRCQASGCLQIFYLCKSCDRGQRYCSPSCRALARRLQHRRASARYQQTPHGRLGHCDCQRAYRQRQRARSAAPPVTDASSNFSDFRSSCGSDHTRPAPHSPIQPRRRTPRPQPSHAAPTGLRCWVCGRPGYLQKRDSYEPDCPST